MKTLSAVLGGYSPKSPDEAKFADKHKIKKTEDANGNDDKLFKASNIKAVNRETPENHGYNPGTDEKVYENFTRSSEKALTKAIKKLPSPHLDGYGGPDLPPRLEKINRYLNKRRWRKPVQEDAYQDQVNREVRSDSVASTREIGKYVKDKVKSVFSSKKPRTQPQTNAKFVQSEGKTMKELAPHIHSKLKSILEKSAKPINESHLHGHDVSKIDVGGTGSQLFDRKNLLGKRIAVVKGTNALVSVGNQHGEMNPDHDHYDVGHDGTLSHVESGK